MRIFPLLLLLALSCSAPASRASAATSERAEQHSPDTARAVEQRLVPLPGDTIDPLLAGEITRMGEESNIGSLKSKVLPEGDLELRVWIGFGLTPTRCIVLRYIAEKSKWLGIRYGGGEPEPLTAPASGWNGLWNRLVAAKLLTLPDRLQLKGEIRVLDGTSYVVEILKDGVYRAYSYLNPDYQPWPEAKRMLEIAEILHTELDLDR